MKKSVRRYNLVLPKELFDEMDKRANRNSHTFVEHLKRYIAIGMLVEDVQAQPGGAVIIKWSDGEKEVIIL